MDILDLRSGNVVKTLIPKVSEGIFDVIAEFNMTDDYVLYYHSGRKTIRAFRRIRMISLLIMARGHADMPNG